MTGEKLTAELAPFADEMAEWAEISLPLGLEALEITESEGAENA